MSPCEELTELALWLIRLEITIIHGRPYHPQTQGKDEPPPALPRVESGNCCSPCQLPPVGWLWDDIHRTLKIEVLRGRLIELGQRIAAPGTELEVTLEIHLPQFVGHGALNTTVQQALAAVFRRYYQGAKGGWQQFFAALEQVLARID